jgi:Na+-transporting methylmalonyl-CoA/oxaloacetate decarboxylase gamma subunit
MGVDWGFAGQVGGIGFGLVFAVLIILALAMWITGLVFGRIGTGKAEKAAAGNKTSNEKKGD